MGGHQRQFDNLALRQQSRQGQVIGISDLAITRREIGDETEDRTLGGVEHRVVGLAPLQRSNLLFTDSSGPGERGVLLPFVALGEPAHLEDGQLS